MTRMIREIDKPHGSAQLIKHKDQLEVACSGTRFGHKNKFLSYSRGQNQPFEPFLIEMDKKSDEYPLFQHSGIEFIYMLQEKMSYKFGDNFYLIESGDSFTFSGEVDRAWP